MTQHLAPISTKFKLLAAIHLVVRYFLNKKGSEDYFLFVLTKRKKLKLVLILGLLLNQFGVGLYCQPQIQFMNCIFGWQKGNLSRQEEEKEKSIVQKICKAAPVFTINRISKIVKALYRPRNQDWFKTEGYFTISNISFTKKIRGLTQQNNV